MEKGWTVGEILRWAAEFLALRQVPDPHIDAGILLAYLLGCEKKELLIHPEKILSGGEVERFSRLVERRAAREPVQYITGEVEFRGLIFKVNRNVLIPRPETELLAEEAIRGLKERVVRGEMNSGDTILNSEIEYGVPGKGKDMTILDLCTGGGCIAISIARELPYSRVYAVDISEGALEVARENAERHGIEDRVIFLSGDLFEGIEPLGLEGEIDLIVSNPPYVSRKEMEGLPPEIRDYEPLHALDGGKDGLDFYRRIIEEAPFYLARGGLLIMEIGYGQSESVEKLLESEGDFIEIEIKEDLAGIDRIIRAKKGTDLFSSRK